MIDIAADTIVEFFRDRFGDGCKLVIHYTKRSSTVLHGEAWFESYIAEQDTRTPAKMHQDALHRLQQTDLSNDLYAARTSGELQVTNHGTGVYLFLDRDNGVFAWIDPETSVTVPEVVTDALEVLEAA